MRRELERRTRRRIAAAAAALALALAAGEAGAISRYTATAMTCASVNATIRKEGAALFQWTSAQTGNRLYGRFVRNESYCLPVETVRTRWIPTADRKSCAVNSCFPVNFLDDDPLRFRFGR